MNAPATPSLRAQLAAPELLIAPGICDPFTARLLESLGFSALYLGGNAIGLQLGVGQPFVTLTETADMVMKVSRNGRAPLIVDSGAGFGDAAHTCRAVREIEYAGAAALHIDDQVYPKRAHYHRGKVRLAAADAVCGKLRTARDARRGDDMLIMARTDVYRATASVEAVIERAARYAAAGAEALVVLDLPPGKAGVVRAALPRLPLLFIGGIAEPVPTVDELEKAGFAGALYPFNTIAGIVAGVTATWEPMRRTGRPGQAGAAGATAEIVGQALRLADMPRYWEIEERTTEAPREPSDARG